MSKKIRNFVFGFFILLFILATPAIILYAFGYSLDMAHLRLQPTGAIYLKSVPAGAEIFLNNQPQATVIASLLNQNKFIVTPARIKNLVPGDYDVKLQLTGYHDWQKKLTITPGGSILAKDINLFKNDPPQLAVALFGSAYQAFSFDNQNDLALLDHQGLTTISLANATSSRQALASASQSIDISLNNIAWSPNNQELTAAGSIYGPTGQVLANLNALNRNLRLARWANNNQLYYLAASGLSYYDLAKKTTTTVVPASWLAQNQLQLDDYYLGSWYLYLVGKDQNNSSQAYILNPESLKIIDQFALPTNGDYTFVNQASANINLLDQSHQTLYLLETHLPLINDHQLTQVPSAYVQGVWLDNDTLLYRNQFEIWLWQKSTGLSTLLTRLSTPILQVAWYNPNYILYATADSLTSLELDERDHYNTVTLAMGKNLGGFKLDSAANALYFFGTVEQHTGLFKLEL